MNKTVCIDSHLVIWGIKRTPTPGQEPFIQKTLNFFNYLDKNKTTVIVPSVVIAEILSYEPPELFPIYMGRVGKGFAIVNFDLQCAIQFAKLFGDKYPQLKEIARTNGIRKEKMKLDHLIVACALYHRADCIYSYDPDLPKFANGVIDIREIPDIPTQLTLESELQTNDSPLLQLNAAKGATLG